MDVDVVVGVRVYVFAFAFVFACWDTDAGVKDEEMDVWRDAGVNVNAFADARSRASAAVFKDDDDGLIFAWCVLCCVVLCVCFERKKEGKFKIGSTVLIIRYFFSCCTVSNVLAYGIEVKFLLGMNQIKEWINQWDVRQVDR